MYTSKDIIGLLKDYCKLFDQILGGHEEYKDNEDLVTLLARSKVKHKNILLLDETIDLDRSEKIARYHFDAKCIERHIIINLNKSLEA